MKRAIKRLVSGILVAGILLGTAGPISYNSSAIGKTGSMDLHQHTFACYEQYWQECDEVHAHELACYGYGGEMICCLEEGQVHQHNEDGYKCEPVVRVLNCGLVEHLHDESCMPALNSGDIVSDDPGTDPTHSVFDDDKDTDDEDSSTFVDPGGSTPTGIPTEPGDPVLTDTPSEPEDDLFSPTKDVDEDPVADLDPAGKDDSDPEFEPDDGQPVVDVDNNDNNLGQVDAEYAGIEPVDLLIQDGEPAVEQTSDECSIPEHAHTSECYIEVWECRANIMIMSMDAKVTFTPRIKNTVVATGNSDQFTFQISLETETNSVVMPTDCTVSVYGTNTASFDEIGFMEPGEFRFSISETEGPSDSYRYDARTWELTVTVTESESGWQAVGSYSMTDGTGTKTSTEEAAFITVYTAPASWDSATVATANRIMAVMTLDEKVGQLILFHYPGNGSGTVAQSETIINKYHIGGYLVFAAMFENQTPASVTKKIKDTQALSEIPLLFTVDEEGGTVTRVSRYTAFRSTKFQSPAQLKATGGLAAIEADAIEKAELLLSLGLNVNHAPVADVAETSSAYMYARSWQANGIETAKFVETLVRTSEGVGLATTMKHFPGYGGTSSNTHNGFAVNPLAMDGFLYNDLLPFQAGMSAGGHSVMVTHNTINAFDTVNPSSLSPAVYSYLRNEMHFDGVAMTDDLNMGAITEFVGAGQASLRALQAGADMAMTDSTADVETVLAAAHNGSLPLEDIETKCRRILCWKIEMGLIEKDAIVEPDPAVDAEAKYTSTDGAAETTGSFADMWSLAVANGGKVELLKDISFSNAKSLNWDCDITLDLCGHDLSYTGSSYAFNVSDGQLTVTDSVGDLQKDEIASGQGQAMMASYDSANEKITYSDITKDKTTVYQVDFTGMSTLLGGMYSTDTGKLVVDNILIRSDSVNAINYAGDSADIRNCAIVDTTNTAIKVAGPSFQMSGSYVVGNRGIQGGGIFVEDWGSITVESSVIACNTATSGGGIFITGRGGSASQPNNIVGSVVTSNTASYGGGIYVKYGELELSGEGGSITYNSATGAAGVYLYNDPTTSSGGYAVRACGFAASGSQVIAYNTATTNGGGIYATDTNIPTRQFDLNGDICIINNSASRAGGVFPNCKAINFAGTIVIKDNTADSIRNMWLGAGNAISMGKMGAETEIHVYTTSRATTIDVATSELGSATEEEAAMFIPERAGYSSALVNRNVVFTTNSVVNMPVTVIIDGKENEVGMIMSMDENGRIDLNDFADVLAPHGFDKDSYDGSFSFGFIMEDETVIVPEDAPVYESNGWKIPFPENCEASTTKLVYLPNGAPAGEYSYQDAIYTNGFWSVRVSDSLGIVDSRVEDMTSIQYVPAGKSVTLELPLRADIWAWAINDHKDTDFIVTMDEQDKMVAITISQIHAPVMITSGQEGNINYVAQYYAYTTTPILHIGTSGSSLNVIDTSRKVMPAMGNTTPALKYLHLVQSNIVDGSYAVEMEFQLKSIYKSKTFSYADTPKLKDANIVGYNDGFELTQLWVLKEGRLSNSTNPDDWDVYSKSALGIDIHNLLLSISEDQVDLNYTVFIKDGAVIRFVYEPADMPYTVPVNMYDYDITDGSTSTVKNSGASGINSMANYKKADGTTASSSTLHLGFGNANTGAQWADQKINNTYRFNRYNGTTYQGCAFNLVSKTLGSDGNLVYNYNIVAPNLFDEGSAIGKRKVDDTTLTFMRSGNTFTLDSIQVEGTTTENLSLFCHPQSKYPNIWTNNFWPVDGLDTTGHDPLFGQTDALGPISDDEIDHNSYFGMTFNIDFMVTEDYDDRLDIFFYGDDDMWVYLDGELVMDIGGVHSSVGEYVNMWDYIGPGEHTLKVFYTERGASGSTCWMQFTAPNAVITTSRPNYEPTQYVANVVKTVEGTDEQDSFTFNIAQIGSSNDVIMPEDATCTVTGSGEAVFNEITFLNAGTYQFKITEMDEGLTGYEYDLEVWTMTVNVDASDFELYVAAVEYSNSNGTLISTKAAQFVNKYSLGEVTYIPKITKQIIGEHDGETVFDFQIIPLESYAEYVKYPESMSVSINGAGEAEFGEFVISTEGTYRFAINENSETSEFYDYDKSIWTLTITVTDEGGKLVADGVYTKDNSDESNPVSAVFINTFKGGNVLPDTGGEGVTHIYLIAASILLCGAILLLNNIGSKKKEEYAD